MRSLAVEATRCRSNLHAPLPQGHVCLLGLLLGNARKGTEDHPAVMWWAMRIVKRCAAARALTIEAMAGELDARAREVSELAPALERMVGGHWLVQRGPGPALA